MISILTTFIINIYVYGAAILSVQTCMYRHHHNGAVLSAIRIIIIITLVCVFIAILPKMTIIFFKCSTDDLKSVFAYFAPKILPSEGNLRLK